MNQTDLKWSESGGRRERARPDVWTACGLMVLWFGLGALLWGCARPPEGPASRTDAVSAHRVFHVRGVVKSLRPDARTAIVRHEAIPGYMEAMTMPFRVRDGADLKGVSPGDAIEFRFHVAEDESWMDQVKVTAPGARAGAVTNRVEAAPESSASVPAASPRRPHPLMDYPFTNQLGQAVSLSDFRGRALGITFIFTRCPVPDYCPRLTKNFQEAAQKLARVPGGPTNWHLISFTIDPVFDTPKILKSYAERHQYDPARWSFLTGPTEQITALVRESGVTVEPDAGLFTHNFRTLIVGTNGQLQTSIPIGGPIADAIVVEMLRAMGVTNADAASGRR